MMMDVTDKAQEKVPFNQEYFSGTYGCDGIRKFGQHWWSIRLYGSIADRWMRIISGTRLLEIGCGHGFLLGQLEKHYETFGVDVSPYAIAQTFRFAPRSRCFVANIERGLPKPLNDYRFDCIIARYVLEHLQDPSAVVSSLVPHLRPGGIFFLSVPNTSSIGARWKGHDWYARKDPTHRSLFSPEKWINIVDQSGLSVVKESSDGYWDVPYVNNVPIWMQYLLFLGPTAFACLTGRDILPPRFGENIMVIARKPAKKGFGG